MEKEITALADGQYFVFGSNTAGRHGAGAAKTAHEKFGAKYGVGEGVTGQSYAFPTLDEDLKHRTHGELNDSVYRLYEVAKSLPDNIFFLTKVGCGLAGYREDYMKSLFKNAPDNIILPKDWQ